MDHETELAIAYDVVVSANETIRGFYDSFSDEDVSYKEDESPLTKADTEANRVIVDELSDAFSQDGVLSEEHADDTSRLEKRRVWIVDPLDGTKEFIKKNGEFTVNVALVVDGKPVLGVVSVPAKRKIYYAVSGAGAFCIDNTGHKTKLKVSSTSDVSSMKLVKSRSHASDDLRSVIEHLGISEVFSSGSSVKGCLVAAGKADVYVRLGNTNEWDVCAMHAIVAEAGGVVTDSKGSAVTYNHEDTLFHGFVISNGKAYEKIIEAVK